MALLCAGTAVISPGSRRVYNVKQYNSLPVTEKRVYSQHGEDGVISSIFTTIGTTNHFFVEIGCGDGSECNTRRLAEDETWCGFKMDCSYSNVFCRIYRETVTPDNVRQLLIRHVCPIEPDLLSIDIDSNDWHVLHAILKQFRPKLIVAEYNANLGFAHDAVVPRYHSEWDGSWYFGASYTAFNILAKHYDYRIVYVESTGTNLFMLRRDCCPQEVLDVERCFWLPGPMLGEDQHRRTWRTAREYICD
jgi:hypothetical protein